MAKTQVSKEIASRAVRQLISKAAKTGGRRFSLGNYVIIPKVVVTRDGLFLSFSRTLPKVAERYPINSVVLDVIGLREKKVTQIEIFNSGTVIYSPKVGRNEEDIKKLVKLISTLNN